MHAPAYNFPIWPACSVITPTTSGIHTHIRACQPLTAALPQCTLLGSPRVGFASTNCTGAVLPYREDYCNLECSAGQYPDPAGSVACEYNPQDVLAVGVQLPGDSPNATWQCMTENTMYFSKFHVSADVSVGAILLGVVMNITSSRFHRVPMIRFGLCGDNGSGVPKWTQPLYEYEIGSAEGMYPMNCVTCRVIGCEVVC